MALTLSASNVNNYTIITTLSTVVTYLFVTTVSTVSTVADFPFDTNVISVPTGTITIGKHL